MVESACRDGDCVNGMGDGMFVRLPLRSNADGVGTAYEYKFDTFQRAKSIEYPVTPMVLKDAVPRVYELDNVLGGACSVWFKMKFANDVLEFPAQLVEYVDLKEDCANDLMAMRQCDIANKRIEKHNLYFCSLMTNLVRLNGCQTSCGSVTCEPAPESALVSYTKKVKLHLDDVVGRLKFNMSYLLENCDMCCVRDYQIEDANYLADCVSFYKAMFARIGARTCFCGDGVCSCGACSEMHKVRARFVGAAPRDWEVSLEKMSEYQSEGVGFLINSMHCAKYPLCLLSYGTRNVIGVDHVFEEWMGSISKAEWGAPLSFAKFKLLLPKRVVDGDVVSRVLAFITRVEYGDDDGDDVDDVDDS